MATITITRHFAAPREVVFERITDFRRAAESIKGIKRIEMLTDGPTGVGTKFKETRVMFGREASEVMEVTAYDPPNGYELGCVSCGCRYQTEFRLTPQGNGTDVAMVFEATPLTFIAKVMGFLMRPMLKKCMQAIAKDLDDLKAAVEGGPKVTV